MNETTRRRLQHAYELIKLKDFGAARPLVIKSLKEDKTNIDAWWLAVYTAKNPAEKRRAVDQVLHLNPHHEAALTLQQRLDEREALGGRRRGRGPALALGAPPRLAPRQARSSRGGSRACDPSRGG